MTARAPDERAEDDVHDQRAEDRLLRIQGHRGATALGEIECRDGRKSEHPSRDRVAQLVEDGDEWVKEDPHEGEFREDEREDRADDERAPGLTTERRMGDR